MTKLDFYINSSETIKLLVKIGLIDSCVLNHISIGIRFRELNSPKMDRYETLSQEFGLQPRQIMNILKDLSSKIDLPPNSKTVSLIVNQI
ncbi:MAG: hypothetical protein ACRCU6_04040 [Fusobacteriaceae bacterium]